MNTVLNIRWERLKQGWRKKKEAREKRRGKMKALPARELDPGELRAEQARLEDNGRRKMASRPKRGVRKMGQPV